MNPHDSTTKTLLTTEAKALVRSLLYFDIFKYPLQGGELLRYANSRSVSQVHLDELVDRKMVHRQGSYYYVGEENGRIERREKGNALADVRMGKARKVSQFIGKFPFVRAVMLSGSLSKGYMEADSDIDYFIITKPGRLWVARTMLIMYKKIFLANSHEDFCVNYFIDEAHLEIEDQNIFTATETVFLLPTYNYPLYEEFRAANPWADAIYANFGLQNARHCDGPNEARTRRWLEALLGGRLGTAFDTWCMKRTLRRWQNKFPDFDTETFEIALRSRKYVSKHHPQQFQRRVLDALEERIQNFESQHGVTL